MNLPTPLLDAAKHYAVEKNTTLTQLVITGLSQVLATEMTTNQPSLLEFIRHLPTKQKLSRTEQKQRYQSAMQKKHG